jgi:hypothetical protein
MIPSLEVATISPLHCDQKKLRLSSGRHRAKGLRAPCIPDQGFRALNHDQGFRALEHDQGLRTLDHDRCFGTGFDQGDVALLWNSIDQEKRVPGPAWNGRGSNCAHSSSVSMADRRKKKRTAPISFRPDKKILAKLLSQAARISDRLDQRSLQLPDVDHLLLLQDCRDELAEIRSYLMMALGRSG